MVQEFLQISAGALLLCSPLWVTWLLVRWLDSRPSAAEKWERNHRNVLRRRDQISKRGW
jgi:hypothetical protein